MLRLGVFSNSAGWIAIGDHHIFGNMMVKVMDVSLEYL